MEKGLCPFMDLQYYSSSKKIVLVSIYVGPENIFGWDGVAARPNTWTVGGHSKIAWVPDSSGSPHFGKIIVRPVSPLSRTACYVP